MNFFEAQDRAHKYTGRLILLFGLAILGLVFLTDLLVLGVYSWFTLEQPDFSPTSLIQRFNWLDFTFVSAGVVLLILLAPQLLLRLLRRENEVVDTIHELLVLLMLLSVEPCYFA